MPFTAAHKLKVELKAIVAIVFGEQKTGKDFFCLQDTPGPIDLMNLDHGLVGLDKQIKNWGTKVRVGGIPSTGSTYPGYIMPIIPKDEELESVTKVAMPIWSTFLTDYQFALSKKSDSKTVVVDTAGAAYDLALMAYVGSSGKVTGQEDPYQRKQTAAKRLFRSLTTAAMESGKNVLFICRCNQKWEGNKPIEGAFKPEGWNGLPYEVMFSIHLSKTMWRGKALRKGIIQDSRLDGSNIDGMEFEADELNFPSVASAVSGRSKTYWKGIEV